MKTYLPTEWQEPAAIVVCLDATMVSHPFPSRETQARHVGTHEVAIRTLVERHGVGEGSWLRWAVRQIAVAVAGPASVRASAVRGDGRAVAVPLVTVLVYCRHGKHRSVGLAYLLCAALQYARFFSVDVLHISTGQWSREGCGNGMMCRACDPAEYTPARQWALSVMRGIAEEELDDINQQ